MGGAPALGHGQATDRTLPRYGVGIVVLPRISQVNLSFYALRVAQETKVVTGNASVLNPGSQLGWE